MARLINRLSKRQVQKLAADGVAGDYPDGQGLYLQITERGTASWISQYKFRKRRRKMGLSSSVAPVCYAGTLGPCRKW